MTDHSRNMKIKSRTGKQVYLLANLYNPAAYEWAWLNYNVEWVIKFVLAFCR